MTTESGLPSLDPGDAAVMDGVWRAAGSERVYSDPWLSLDLVEVTPPGRRAYRHHVVRVRSAVGMIIKRDDGRVLLLRRHRFITDTTGFEIPAGAIEEGESIEEAARRETMEETGLEVDGLELFLSCSPSDGVTDQRFHIVRCRMAADTGVVRDAHESSARVWADRAEIETLVRAGAIPGALTLVALMRDLLDG